jgi:hypothetical protein
LFCVFYKAAAIQSVSAKPDIFIKTSSLYAGICDQQSPANIDGFMDDLLAAAHREAQEEGFGAGHGVFLFNTVLMRRAEQGEILTWPLLYDGVFRCEFKIHAADAALSPRAPARDNLGSGRVTGKLHFPSGRVIVSCLRGLGESRPSAVPVATIEPGWYEVTLTRDDAMEARHALLESASDYPTDDGPDWMIELRATTA